MGCHTIEAARYFFGKDVPVTEAFAWGATLTHGDKTTGEDNAVAMLKFANGGISITEASWSAKGGMELRNEIFGTEGRLITDTTATPVWGFIAKPAGYLMEKADAETGWVYPIPDEARVYGYPRRCATSSSASATGTEPRETFVDGYIVNCMLDACYRSMKSGRWEPVELDAESPAVIGRRPETATAPASSPARASCSTALGATQEDALERGGRALRRRDRGRRPRARCSARATRGSPVEEMFPRYGSYPGFHPIVELSMTFHTQVVGANGQRQAMFIERVEGLAEAILRNFELHPPDVMIVFSARRDHRRADRDGDGRARARPAGHRGHAVAATAAAGAPTRRARACSTTPTSCSTSARPRRRAGARSTGLDTPVGPGSTIAAVALVNELKVRTAELLVERGAMPPVLTSAAVVGAERVGRLFDAAYAEHARRAARVLEGARMRSSRQQRGGGSFVSRSRRARQLALLALPRRRARAGRRGLRQRRRQRRAPARGSGGGGKKTYTIGVSNTLVGNGWREEMICAVKAQALASGKVDKVLVHNHNGDAAEQIAGIRNLISSGANAIIVNPADRRRSTR